MYDNKLFRWSRPVMTGWPGSTMPPYEYAGFVYDWIEYGAVGGVQSPSWDVLDIRAQYNRRFGSVSTEFFVDALGVFNSQKPWRVLPLIRGQAWAGREFGDAYMWAPPSRYYLGVRVSF